MPGESIQILFCLALVAAAIWGLQWVIRVLTDLDREAEALERRITAAEREWLAAHGDVVKFPEDFRPARSGKTRGSGAEQGERTGTHKVTSLTDDRGGL
jgi:hypothetical protein